MTIDEPLNKGTKPGKKRPWLARWFHVIRHHPWIYGAMVLGIGGIGIATMDMTDYYLTSDNFCVYSCHVMEIPYEELKKSKHWTTPSGVRPTCADCHVSGRLTFAMWDHFIGTGELFVWLTNDFSEPATFEELRPAAANRARFVMLENNSETCRGCHVMEAIKPTKFRGQQMHADAIKKQTTCIVCHYNLVHKEVPPSKEFLETTRHI